jgi:hypothetical protein
MLSAVRLPIDIGPVRVFLANGSVGEDRLQRLHIETNPHRCLNEGPVLNMVDACRLSREIWRLTRQAFR